MVMEEDEADRPVYIEGYLHKKEEKWTEFWIVLRECYLQIHQRKPKDGETLRDLLIGWIQITDQTRCIMGKKKSYSFPFYIQTKKGKYLFKTPSTLSRHQWVKAIELCIHGKSPQLIPRTLKQVDRCMVGSPGNGRFNSSYESTNYDETIREENLLGAGEIPSNASSSDNHELNVEDFQTISMATRTEINDEAPSNVILVSTGCEHTSNFLPNTVSAAQDAARTDNNADNESSNSVAAFLPYKQSVHDKTAHLFVEDVSSMHARRLTKSAESLRQLNLLDNLRTNSDSSVGRHVTKMNVNCRHFSRHLNKSSVEDDDDTLALI